MGCCGGWARCSTTLGSPAAGGALADAEQAFADGVAADHAGDGERRALRLNRATPRRRRAARHADAAEGARRAAVAALARGGRLALPRRVGGGARARRRGGAAARRRRRAAVARDGTGAACAVRAVEPELLARAVAQHAADEAAAGGALHAIVADGGGDEATVRAAAEALARAQASFDEIGELAHVQLMRRQGSLFLAAALRDEADGAGPAKSKARLTLALRHYARALAEPLLRAASAPMERCAAEARLELAQFYLARAEVLGGGGGGGGGAGAAGGERQRSYEMALEQARAALRRCAAGAPGERRWRPTCAARSPTRSCTRCATSSSCTARRARRRARRSCATSTASGWWRGGGRRR